MGIMDLGRYSHGRYSLIFGRSKIAERILEVSDRTIGPALASCCLTVCSMVSRGNDASPFPPNFLPTKATKNFKRASPKANQPALDPSKGGLVKRDEEKVLIMTEYDESVWGKDWRWACLCVSEDEYMLG